MGRGAHLRGHGAVAGSDADCRCGRHFPTPSAFSRHCADVLRRKMQPMDVKHTLMGRR